MAGEPVLVVDDNAANLALAEAVLERAGFQVRTAMDAAQMHAVLATFKPRVILMDIQLPDVDGLELTRRLKADPATSDVKVIALTAYAMKGDEQKALAAGCDGYITKPISTRELGPTVAKYIGS